MKTNILALDGGGVRGIIPALVLEQIEKYIISITKDENARISDYLDFCGGTSTGSIIAAMINIPGSDGRPLYKMSDIVTAYMTFAGSVFKKSIKQNIKSLWGLLGPKYDSREIESELQKIMKEYTMKDLLTPCAFTSYDIYKRRPIIYTSADKGGKYALHKIKNIVRGSTSIPAFFKPEFFRTGKEVDTLVDGGLFANNPSLISFIEAGKTPSILDTTERVTTKNSYLLSLGTGQAELTHYSYKKTKKWGIARWLVPMLNILLQGIAEITTYETMKIYESSDSGKNFVRINPEINLGKSDSTNSSAENMDNLMQDAKLYIDDNHKYLKSIATILIANKEKTK